MHIGKSTRIALAKREKNIKWLAEQMSVSETRASNIVNAKSVTADTIRRLSAIFDMKCSEFIALGE